MKCPVDGETLVMADRNGVEIDYCPSCRGVWLDRGELDKIVERSVPPAAPQSRFVDRDEDDYGHSGRPGKKKRESFLGELFDF